MLSRRAYCTGACLELQLQTYTVPINIALSVYVQPKNVKDDTRINNSTCHYDNQINGRVIETLKCLFYIKTTLIFSRTEESEK
jgi:hypothetical protein